MPLALPHSGASENKGWMCSWTLVDVFLDVASFALLDVLLDVVLVALLDVLSNPFLFLSRRVFLVISR